MKRWVALLLVMLLVLSAAGCSTSGSEDPGGADETAGETGGTDGEGDDDSGDAAGETGDDTSGEGEEALVEGDFYTFDRILDIIDNFKEMSYTFQDIQNGQAVSSLTMEYVFLGDESVDGQNTRHVKITAADATPLELWINDEGTAVKAIVEGQTFDAMMAEAFGGSLVAVMAPFAIYSGFEEVFVEENAWRVSGWDLKHRGSDNRDLGAGNVAVRSYEFEYLNMGFIYYFEVANINGHNMFIMWNVRNEDDDTEQEFKVTRLIPR